MKITLDMREKELCKNDERMRVYRDLYYELYREHHIF